VAASTYAGYRAVSSHRAGRNPAGLPEADLAPAQRRQAAARFSGRGQRHAGSELPLQEEASAAPVETEGSAPAEGEGAVDETSALWDDA